MRKVVPGRTTVPFIYSKLKNSSKVVEDSGYIKFDLVEGITLLVNSKLILSNSYYNNRTGLRTSVSMH